MILKKFDDIGQKDIENLLETEQAEDRKLEYKAALPDFNDRKKKRKFLALVSSFANTVGGDIIYGISEREENGNNTGVPGEIHGIRTDSPDQTVLKLMSFIRTCIQPSIVPSVQIKPINGFEKGPVILIRVPQSATAPHMVWKDRVSQFYIRSSNSTNPMDVGEIRSAFALSDSMAERMKEFRAQRISQMLADDGPVSLQAGSKAIVHFLPYDAFNPFNRPDYMEVITKTDPIRMFPVRRYSGGDYRYNFDGFVAFTGTNSGGTLYMSYVQVFRSGIIEVCSQIGRESDGREMIPPSFEKEIMDNAARFIDLYKEMNVVPPVLVFLSLVNVRGCDIYNPNAYATGDSTPIDRDFLFLPEILLDNYEKEPKVFFKMAFDSIWQACGYDRSYNYNEEGEWIGPRR